MAELLLAVLLIGGSLLILWRVNRPHRPVRRSPATGEVIGGVHRLEGETRPLRGKHRPARAAVPDVVDERETS